MRMQSVQHYMHEYCLLSACYAVRYRSVPFQRSYRKAAHGQMHVFYSGKPSTQDYTHIMQPTSAFHRVGEFRECTIFVALSETRKKVSVSLLFIRLRAVACAI